MDTPKYLVDSDLRKQQFPISSFVSVEWRALDFFTKKMNSVLVHSALDYAFRNSQ